MDVEQQIERFLEGSPHAVVGASQDRAKYGNKVLRAYLQTNRLVYPINPKAETIEGHACFARLSDAPRPLYGVSLVTPPRVTQRVVAEAIEMGIEHIWMQPGAESEEAIAQARAAGANVIANGPCLLVALRFREETS